MDTTVELNSEDLHVKIVPLLALLCMTLSACSKQTGSKPQDETTAIEIRIALRSEPYKTGDEANSGTFEELNLHVIPVTIGDKPVKVVSVSDGVVIEASWQEASLSQRFLILKGFSYEVKSKLVSPHGDWRTTGQSGPEDIGLNEEWRYLVTPVSIDPGSESAPQLVIQARWTGSRKYVPRDLILKPKTAAPQGG